MTQSISNMNEAELETFKPLSYNPVIVGEPETEPEEKESGFFKKLSVGALAFLDALNPKSVEPASTPKPDYSNVMMYAGIGIGALVVINLMRK